ncbi:MAG: hypothetical protein ACRDNY_13485 [Gaiellaceae bacterium]
MQIELGFRAYDPHELLPHVLAARLGLYENAGVDVRLRDLTFTDTPAAQVSCGAALLARLHEAPLRIVLVACRRPLFWVVTRERGALLDTARIASYPEGSPPALFVRMLLPSAQVEPARDNDARIGLLLADEVDGAVISSAEPPMRIEELGLHPALAFGDVLTLPTTGLAVPESMLDREEIAGVVGGLCAALAVIQRDHDQVAEALVENFRYDVASAEKWALSNAGAFSVNGTMSRGEAEAAIDLVAQALGVAAMSVDVVFETTALS